MDIKDPVNLAMDEKSDGMLHDAGINFDYFTGKV